MRSTIQQWFSWYFFSAHNFNQPFIQKRFYDSVRIYAANLLNFSLDDRLFICDDGKGLKRGHRKSVGGIALSKFLQPLGVMRVGHHLIAVCDFYDEQSAVSLPVLGYELIDELFYVAFRKFSRGLKG